MDSARTEVAEAAEKDEGIDAMIDREENLKDDGELIRWVSMLHGLVLGSLHDLSGTSTCGCFNIVWMLLRNMCFSVVSEVKKDSL